MGLDSARAECHAHRYRDDKILRVARTIADLDNSSDIRPALLNEAINYPMLDRKLWT